MADTDKEVTQPLLKDKDVEAGAALEAKEAKHSLEPTLGGRLLNEFIGTFFLVLTVSLVVAQTLKDSTFANAGLSIGTILGVFIYNGGHISGAHYNPAVTLGVLLAGRGKISPKDAGLYVLAQLLGGTAAAFTGVGISEEPWGPMPGASYGVGRALIAEIVFTMALVSVVLNVATVDKVSANNYYGFAIGMLVFVGATAAGGISSAVFNPAVGTGIGLVEVSFAGTCSMWVYWLGPCVGAVFAAGLFRLTNIEEYKKE